LAIATTGGVLSGLVLWPESLFPAGLVDLFAGMLFVGLACYCLGLLTARKASTFTSALCALPLALILNLLIVIKGFELPLICITTLFIGASLAGLLKPSQHHLRTVFATGLQVMVLLGITIFLGRHSCEVALVAKLPPGADYVMVRDSGLLLRENENDLDSKPIIGVTGDMDSFGLPTRRNRYEIHYSLASLGIADYLESREPRGGRIQLDYFGYYWGIYLDQARGLIVSRGDRHEFYIGPQGISKTPDNNLGRFLRPIIYRGRLDRWSVVYDQRTNCFFAIDIKERTVRRGPKLIDPACRPIDVVGSDHGLEDCSVYFSKRYGRGGQTVYGTTDYLAALYESGVLDLFDRETLQLSGPAGHLPRPRTLFGWGSGKPKDLLAYDVELLAAEDQRKYIGMAVASLSRQGTSLALAVFDREGKQVKTAYSKSGFFDVPGGPALTITKYLFESLHPPVLTLASFFTAYSFEARSTHRALFLMPNSFVAMARDYEGNIFYALMIALLLMLPALLFAALLSLRVARDAKTVGLSHNARRLWVLGALAFGLAGYITYRLTRPKITLVTCANCGRPRRPDMDKCHRCGSVWQVPELTPPTWRVLDKKGQIRPGTPGPAEESTTE